MEKKKKIATWPSKPPCTTNDSNSYVISQFKQKNDTRGHRKNKKNEVIGGGGGGELEKQMKKKKEPEQKKKKKLVEFFKIGQSYWKYYEFISDKYYINRPLVQWKSTYIQVLIKVLWELHSFLNFDIIKWKQLSSLWNLSGVNIFQMLVRLKIWTILHNN